MNREPDASVRNPDWVADRLIGPAELALIADHPVSKGLDRDFQEAIYDPDVFGFAWLMMVRTRCIDELMERAVRSGATQLVILGAESASTQDCFPIGSQPEVRLTSVINHALANCQSRPTVRAEGPIASAVSSSVGPPNYRNWTTFACRGASRSRTSSESFKASRGRMCRLSPPLSPYLQYDKALAEGVPIATGVIEGACRHLDQDRMNLTGARWGSPGAEAVLRLRALRSSNDFDAYWQIPEQQEYERNHASHYANHRVPETLPSAVFLSQPSRRSTLKIVKKKEES